MDGQELRAVRDHIATLNPDGTVTDGRRFVLYPDPDPRRSGEIGYLCEVCGQEARCPRYGLPARGFSLTAMTPGASPRLVWVCSPVCLRAHADTL